MLTVHAKNPDRTGREDGREAEKLTSTRVLRSSHQAHGPRSNAARALYRKSHWTATGSALLQSRKLGRSLTEPVRWKRGWSVATRLHESRPRGQACQRRSCIGNWTLERAMHGILSKRGDRERTSKPSKFMVLVSSGGGTAELQAHIISIALTDRSWSEAIDDGVQLLGLNVNRPSVLCSGYQQYSYKSAHRRRQDSELKMPRIGDGSRKHPSPFASNYPFSGSDPLKYSASVDRLLPGRQ